VSASTALGLHREIENRPITFVSEMKRRIFTVVFNIDKGSSLLTGRPPALRLAFSASLSHISERLGQLSLAKFYFLFANSSPLGAVSRSVADEILNSYRYTRFKFALDREQ